MGDRAVKDKNYYGAARMYKKALDMNRSLMKVAYKYAEACRMNNDYTEASKWYGKIAMNDEENYPLSRYLYAEMLKNQGLYQKAQINYRKYYLAHKNEKTFYLKKAEHELVSCEKAMYIKFEPKIVDIQQFDTVLNSLYSEFGTFQINDSVLFFSSLRPSEINPNSYKASIFRAEKDKSSWLDKGLLDTVFQQYNVSNPSYDNKGKQLYFTVSSISGQKLSSIYRIKLEENKWTKPEKLPEIINKINTYTSQPSVANTAWGSYLLFISDRDLGIGKLDIWASQIDSLGNFSPPFNLGKKINSIDDEITPNYDPKDSTLYFSSLWFNNLGGFDIFKSKGDFTNWTVPENIGYPYNSSVNDLYYNVNPDHSQAILSSNREGSRALKNECCCNDLYYHNIPKTKEELVLLEQQQQVKMMTRELKLLVPLTLYFHNDEPNPKTTDTITTVNYEESVKNYLLMLPTYKTEFSKGLKKNDAIIAADDVEDFFIEKVEKGYDKLQQFAKLMEELLAKGEDINITLKGYTSPLNTTEYNEKLARRRVASLVNYFYKYNNGLFLKHLDKEPGTGKLTFEKVAFGEELADKTISDDINDKRNSVYNPKAAAERKIQIIAVSVK